MDIEEFFNNLTFIPEEKFLSLPSAPDTSFVFTFSELIKKMSEYYSIDGIFKIENTIYRKDYIKYLIQDNYIVLEFNTMCDFDKIKLYYNDNIEVPNFTLHFNDQYIDCTPEILNNILLVPRIGVFTRNLIKIDLGHFNNKNIDSITIEHTKYIITSNKIIDISKNYTTKFLIYDGGKVSFKDNLKIKSSI